MNLSITTNNTYAQSTKPNNNKTNLIQPNFKSNPILKETTKKAATSTTVILSGVITTLLALFGNKKAKAKKQEEARHNDGSKIQENAKDIECLKNYIKTTGQYQEVDHNLKALEIKAKLQAENEALINKNVDLQLKNEKYKDLPDGYTDRIKSYYLENVDKINEYSFEQIQFDLLIEDFLAADEAEYLRAKQSLNDLQETIRNLNITPNCDKDSLNESIYPNYKDLEDIFD